MPARGLCMYAALRVPVAARVSARRPAICVRREGRESGGVPRQACPAAGAGGGGGGTSARHAVFDRRIYGAWRATYPACLLRRPLLE